MSSGLEIINKRTLQRNWAFGTSCAAVLILSVWLIRQRVEARKYEDFVMQRNTDGHATTTPDEPVQQQSNLERSQTNTQLRSKA